MQTPISNRILLVCAMKAEMRPLRRALGHLPLRMITTGIGPVRAATAIQKHAHQSRLIISTGCCGGLAPQLSPGCLIIPRHVLEYKTGQAFEVPAPDPLGSDAARSIAQKLGLPYRDESLLSVNQVLTNAHEKRLAYQQSNAVAVDMETAAIAQVAHQMRIPYVSMRSVLDTAEEDLHNPSDLALINHSSTLSNFTKRLDQAVTLTSLASRWCDICLSLIKCLENLCLQQMLG